MPRPIHVIVHPEALRHNLERARAAAPDAKVMAVVKANAYGHGIEPAFHALRGADGFALLDLAEAQVLRSMDWRGPILLLEGIFEARDLELCSRLRLWHVIHSEWQIDALAQHKTQEPHRVFLKLNSGMQRLGLRPDAFRAAWARLSALPQVEEISVMTHFANADATPSQDLAHLGTSVDDQVGLFAKCTQDSAGESSLANSAAILRHGHRPQVRGDWTRPGIMLYGSSPDHPEHDIGHWDLRPSMSLRSQVIAVQDLASGESVGYGSRWTAEAPTRVGVVACGYADGYPRVAPAGTPVLIDGHRTRLLGRVSMDMLTVDLTPVPMAGRGSEATLWGQASSGAVLPIDEVAAAAAGTLGYELMCAIAPRVRRELAIDSLSPGGDV